MSRTGEDKRDLVEEQLAFEQRGWVFRVHTPVPTTPPNAPDPRIQRSFLAKAEKAGDARRFQMDGPTADAATAALLDVMTSSL